MLLWTHARVETTAGRLVCTVGRDLPQRTLRMHVYRALHAALQGGYSYRFEDYRWVVVRTLFPNK